MKKQNDKTIYYIIKNKNTQNKKNITYVYIKLYRYCRLQTISNTTQVDNIYKYTV